MSQENRYYSIGVVSRMLGINQQTIRFYEQRGLINPVRSAGKTRMFSDNDIQVLKLILRLSQELGVNLAGIEIILRLNHQIRQFQSEQQYLVKLIFEAGEWIQSLMNDIPASSTPVKSSLGHLLKMIQIK